MASSASLTIFAAPRAFEGEFERIQMNALQSWSALRPRPEVIIFGNEPGTEGACAELGIRWVSDVETTPSGAPLLSSLLVKVQEIATGDLLAYINPDVIVLQDFIEAIASVQSRFARFALVGAPRNSRVMLSLTGPPEAWSDAVGEARRAEAGSPTPTGADLFVFPSGTLDPVPALAVGRLWWDNWLVWRASMLGLPVVDISEAATFIHQDHTGSTHHGSETEVRASFGVEIDRNRSLLHWWERVALRGDVGYELSPGGEIRRRRMAGRTGFYARVGARQAELTARAVVRRLLDATGQLDRYRRWKRRGE